MSKLGLNIKKHREQSGLTQTQLGAKVGLAESTISLYESGKREPDLDTVQALANLFDVSIDYLLGRTDNPKPPSSVDDDEFHPTPDGDLLIFYKARELSEESQKLIQEQIDHLHRLEHERWENDKSKKGKKEESDD